jgi:hypothetical protein
MTQTYFTATVTAFTFKIKIAKNRDVIKPGNRMITRNTIRTLQDKIDITRNSIDKNISETAKKGTKNKK